MLMNDPNIELSIVMPCLNEVQTLATCIKKARQAMHEHAISGEIIVADNGSTDGSQALAADLQVRIVSVPTKGYGHALMGGIQAARGELIIMGDADDSYDFANIFTFVEKLRDGYDLVIGNRFKGGIETGAMPSLHKYIGNPILTGIGKLLFRSPVGDFHCGLRGFRRAAILKLSLQTGGMEFASEMIVKGTLADLKIAEVPTTLSTDGRQRAPHLRSWRDGWRHLRFMLLYSPRWLFLYPGLLLMLAGLLVGIWLIPGQRTVGSVNLNIHTLLYAAMAVILGFQSIVFAVFTKVFAVMEGLLPANPLLNRLLSRLSLEFGLVIGAALFMMGIGGSVYAVVSWGANSFGDLDPSKALRIIIPSVTLSVVGFEIILSSFAMSILGLKRR